MCGAVSGVLEMINVVWDMETGDPDDFLTLLLLLGHPKVNLKAVTITPGTPDQVGLVRAALAWFERDIPVGAYHIKHNKSCVSWWHYKVYGEIPPSVEAEPAAKILLEYCDKETTLITGGPLKNLGAAIALAKADKHNFQIGRLVAQGGFAGEGVVPADIQLPKFKGMVTCATYNFNGDPYSALATLNYQGIGTRRFVSKNVCHRVIYDLAMHEVLRGVKDKSQSLALIYQGMDAYLNKRPRGKKFHDPLTACCAIDESIGTWAEVELYRKGGKWGARLSPGSKTWIITDYNHDKFVATLTAT